MGNTLLLLANSLHCSRGVLGCMDLIQEMRKGLGLGQAGGADRSRRQDLQQLLSGPRLELKEILEFLSRVMRARGILNRAADFVKTRKPGESSGHGTPVNAGASLGRFLDEGNSCAIAH